MSEYKFNKHTQTIEEYLGKSKIVSIPSKIEGVEVKKIGVNAFLDKDLSEINIPNSVTHIGSHAFSYNRLKEVNIPNSVTHIELGAFEHSGIYRLNISESVKYIEEYAFCDNKIQKITIGKNVVSIGDDAFGSQFFGMQEVIISGNENRFNNQWTKIGFPENLMPVSKTRIKKNKTNHEETLKSEEEVEDFDETRKEILKTLENFSQLKDNIARLIEENDEDEDYDEENDEDEDYDEENDEDEDYDEENDEEKEKAHKAYVARTIMKMHENIAGNEQLKNEKPRIVLSFFVLCTYADNEIITKEQTEKIKIGMTYFGFLGYDFDGNDKEGYIIDGRDFINGLIRIENHERYSMLRIGNEILTSKGPISKKAKQKVREYLDSAFYSADDLNLIFN